MANHHFVCFCVFVDPSIAFLPIVEKTMVVLFESLNRHENLNDSRNYCEFGVMWGLVPKHPPPPSDLARGAATDHADQVGRSQGWG